MPKVLQLTQFGNPILRKKAKLLTQKEIKAKSTQNLIANMRYTMKSKGYGVALAAPQVAKSIALFVIAIKPNSTHPTRNIINKVCINPKIIKSYGKKQPMWEGCMSLGESDTTLFGQTNRWPKLSVKYIDENGTEIVENLEGLEAHVFQHEYDHLQGILFVDKVKDTKTYMTMAEYKKRILGLSTTSSLAELDSGEIKQILSDGKVPKDTLMAEKSVLAGQDSSDEAGIVRKSSKLK